MSEERNTQDTEMNRENEPPHFPEDPHAIIPSPETTPMEVHHHPHVGKKNFKEYLLEGLMIFLAVSMGFIAENIREKISEHEIEKRNIELIVDNLKEDTTALRKVIINKAKASSLIDSLLMIRDKNLNDSNVYKEFNLLYARLGSLFWFHSNNSGLDQMKNSGSLRLIKKKQVLDSLYLYEKGSRNIEFGNGDPVKNVLDKADELAGGFMVYDHMKPRAFNLEQHKDEINRFYNYYFGVNVNYKGFYIPQCRRQLERAKRLISLLQEEYKIEK
ncbi:MAG: hypothetical protein V4539_00880 [Bacteroidota bacterium]